MQVSQNLKKSKKILINHYSSRVEIAISNQLENALDDLKQLIGLPLSDDIDIVAETSQESIEADLEIAINYGLKK